ncbi:hypothetical protein D0Z07_0286 [Hyphodiscus hymeniophilus]|uniref:CENP-V/GFA domain-containing protein n=1 Tax=Hyphodiscus hymeniophilus TaxID=353542 RepID=A0A9P6VQB7_9HELO|nr:hypothetical protein D0Z07_0286 [Hyphodiscus hymeniophilus]
MATHYSKPYFPLAGIAEDAFSKEDEATATCFCGAVQLTFVPSKVVTTFVCNCSDCHKVTASMFASNFTVNDEDLKWLRGKENLKVYSQAKTPISGKAMTNYFCSTCGTLMNRVGTAYPGQNFLRIGTVDDFSLHETVLRPQNEVFMKYKNNWVPSLSHVEGIKQYQGFFE